MPTLETEKIATNGETSEKNLSESTVLQQKIEIVINAIFDLGKTTQENETRRKELEKQLLELFNFAKMDKEQRRAFIMEVRQRRVDMPTQMLTKEKRDPAAEDTKEVAAISEDTYANLISFKRFEQSLDALPFGRTEERKEVLIKANRQDISLRNGGTFSALLLEQATHIIEVDLPPPNKIERFSFKEHMQQLIRVAQEAIQRRRKKATTLKEAAQFPEVYAAIEGLCAKIDSIKKIPYDKKMAVFAFLKEATSVPYESTEKETAVEEPVADAA
ncbi:hypothetical protein HY625_02255 [Candidatus Uhrbacteria bacterium]|nr:hypothetical protein [Candidatus Uhrbacteria bacterium]